MVFKPGKLVFKTCSAQIATVGIVNVSDSTTDVDVVIFDSKNFSSSFLGQILLNFFGNIYNFESEASVFDG
jgi:hypothetical protein